MQPELIEVLEDVVYNLCTSLAEKEICALASFTLSCTVEL